MKNHAQILLFHIGSDKTKQLEHVCRRLKIQVTKIEISSYRQKLGCLAGISGFDRENVTYIGPDFPSEMMVFSGMDSDMVDTFLCRCKEASIPPIGLKAIITSHNIFWTAEDLYRELSKEHLAFHNR